MRILEINNSDLVGRAFNGYDLHCKLNKTGHEAYMLVVDKYSNDATVESMDISLFERERIRFIEEKQCLNNIYYPYAASLVKNEHYINSDILHYHFTYHQMFSLYDYQEIMDARAVWTIHDLWMITGNCINPPKRCKKWQTQCFNCDNYDNEYFPMKEDNTKTMWTIKKECLGKINPHIIVASEYMKRCLNSSPITKHFSKIHIIPFGIDLELYQKKEKKNSKEITIGFRAEDEYIKGCDLLYDALRKVCTTSTIKLSCVGNGKVPNDIKNKFELTEHGWMFNKEDMVSFYKRCDIFIIPSRQETFCLMAIEAMAAGCLVVCFKDTIVEEVSGAPQNAIAVDYENTDALAVQIEYLVDNKNYREEIIGNSRSFIKRYNIENYVEAHIELFENVITN
ncbi:glycosyltransferase [Butyrivibrio sp. LC3010]|uniref:glycosyltransferase n=1 Tax=Butyrivibrio sp. LC3010 TaxID=1280680 RepID=UPI000421FA23|nr:glycosyltransferase [Butyrivibrio sp. LC3010]